MSSIFDLHIQVQPHHIDALGHVNNVMYVQWMQDVAAAHVETLGVGVTKYLELKHAMVAVEHHVQYRKAAFEGEQIVLRTWLDDINALYSFASMCFFVHQIRPYYLLEIPNGHVLKLLQDAQNECRQLLPMHTSRLTQA